MRIPVFRSQAQATNEAPGRSLQVRMNAQPFVQAALAKGGVLTDLAKTVSSYAAMRAEAEAKIQYNEAMLAAEEEMRTLADSLKDSSRLGDVINEDGTGSWQTATTEMRERLAEGMMSRSMEDAFNARFNQQELTLRFQLRDEIDRRIQARAAAASAARQASMVAQLSDHRASLELLPLLLASNDEEMRADVQAGIISPEMRMVVNQRIIDDIASGATTSYVGSDPTRAIALARALEYQDMVDNGELTSEEAAQLSGLGDDAAYVFTVLQLAPRNVALAALGDAITSANKIDGALDELRSENEANQARQATDVYNSIFGVAPDAPASADLTARLQVLAPGILEANGIMPGQEITGRQYIDAATAFLDSRNAITPQQRETVATHRTPTTTGPFAAEDNSAVYATLLQQATAGTLTTETLNSNQSALTSATWTTLLNRVSTEADQSLSLADDQIASAFRYNKIAGASDEATREAESSYAAVSTQLQAEYNARRAAGEPMTSTEINARAGQLVEERMVRYRENLQAQLSDYLTTISARTAGLPSFSVGNELEQLDSWYNSLTQPTPTQQSSYVAIRAEINRRLQMIRGN